MYSKEEEKEIKLQFWGSLNSKFEETKGVHGNKVAWMSFNTKIKSLFFRMEADREGARLCIDIQFLDESMRELFYEQFTEFENILQERFSNNLVWLPRFEHTNGRTIARIYSERRGINMYNRDDWGEIHKFLLSEFVKLEAFWAEFGEVFWNLKN